MRIQILLAIVVLLAPTALASITDEENVVAINIDGFVSFYSTELYMDTRGIGEVERNFLVESESIRVELDNKYIEGHDYGITSQGNYTQTVLYDGPGQLTSGPTHDNHRITLVSQDSIVNFNSDGFNATLREGHTITRAAPAGTNRSDEVFYFGPTFAATGLHGSVQITGNFSFILRDWDGVLNTPETQIDFWTGVRREVSAEMKPVQETIPDDIQEDIPDPNPLYYGGTVETQIAFVYVTNGTMTFDIIDEEAGSAYVFNKVAGEAFGRFDSYQFSYYQYLGLSDSKNGNYSTIIQAPRDNELTIDLKPFKKPLGQNEATPGTSTEENKDDSNPGSQPTPAPVELIDTKSSPTPQIPSGGITPYIWWALLAATPIPLAILRFTRPIVRIRKLEDAYDLSLYAYVLDRAPQLLSSRRFGARASLMYAIALLEKKGPEAAESHLMSSRPRNRPTGATLDYLMARVRAAQTRFDEARIHVRACIQAEPAFIMEINRNATLEFLSHAPSDPDEGYS